MYLKLPGLLHHIFIHNIRDGYPTFDRQSNLQMKFYKAVILNMWAFFTNRGYFLKKIIKWEHILKVEVLCICFLTTYSWLRINSKCVSIWYFFFKKKKALLLVKKTEHVAPQFTKSCTKVQCFTLVIGPLNQCRALSIQ